MPKFSYDAELKLKQAALAYDKNGTVLIPDPKSDILDGLAQEIVQYKVYVTDKEMEQVAQSLIRTYPCLSERGSSTGYCGCKTSLKYIQLPNSPEKTGLSRDDSIKNKPAGKRSADLMSKRLREQKWTFVQHSSEETEESLEAMQKSLLLDIKKKNNQEVVKLKIKQTFAHWRHEVVPDATMVENFIAMWPATMLFYP